MRPRPPSGAISPTSPVRRLPRCAFRTLDNSIFCIATVAFVHGPQGSGKSRLLGRILKDIDRCVSPPPTSCLAAHRPPPPPPSSALVIDCAPLLHAGTDARLLAALAAQTGYWPVFTFLNSVNHLVDLASVGLIGQKGACATLSLSLSPSSLCRERATPS